MRFGQELFHAPPVDHVAFVPNKGWLAAGSRSGSLRLWDTTLWTVKTVLEPGEKPSAVAVSPDGATVGWGVRGAGALIRPPPPSLEPFAVFRLPWAGYLVI